MTTGFFVGVGVAAGLRGVPVRAVVVRGVAAGRADGLRTGALRTGAVRTSAGADACFCADSGAVAAAGFLSGSDFVGSGVTSLTYQGPSDIAEVGGHPHAHFCGFLPRCQGHESNTEGFRPCLFWSP